MSLFIFNIVLCSFNSIALATELRGEVYYGNASWYGSRFHGRKTSSGERFNKNRLTAAHKTLPFDTVVKVTNLQNNKSVNVRINDRGPFKQGRIIDLSERAAEVIEAKKQGIAYVKVQILKKGEEQIAGKKLVSSK